MIRWTNREKQILHQLTIGADINLEYTQQPGIYARYGFIGVRCDAEVARLKENLAQLEIDLVEEVKDQIAEVKADEAGVEMEDLRVYKYEIDRAVKRDPKRRRLVKQLRKAQLEASVMKVALEALKQRKEMLISHGAQLREEHGAEISISKRDRKRGS